tara:strand:+ start:352 stop:720 length:369 start_codon:yes stop_codon:yes gene_type:complete
MSNPKDKILYEKIKTKVKKENPTHSAYRSGHIVKEYKKAYYEKHKSKEAYKGTKKENEGLSRWYKEEWKNQRGEVGYKKKGDIYRPTKRVNKDTPKTHKELSKKDKEKAMKEKNSKGRVKKF